jgi:cell division septal protein FtsQ
MASLVALAAFPQSALFVLDRIEVAGAETLSPEAVIAISGLRAGQRLFAVDAAGAVRRLRADPRIRAAEVRLRPPRAALVTVEERRPVMALVVGAGFALVDEHLVAVALARDAGGLPEVVDRSGRTAWARAGAPVPSEAARVALAALGDLPSWLRGDLRRMAVGPAADLTLSTRSGLELRAGGLAGLQQRLAQVPEIIDTLRARAMTVSVIDLRYEGSVAVKATRGGEGP